MLENIYLCGINNNLKPAGKERLTVVICLKISTFVVSTTTILLLMKDLISCDLLENIYLCGINNNYAPRWLCSLLVVICLKISTFVVSTTTGSTSQVNAVGCDLLENIYLCGINNNSC